MGSIRSAYHKNQVDDDIVDLRFIETQIEAGEDTVKETLGNCPPTGMPDTTAELRDWASFQEEKLSPPRMPKALPPNVPIAKQQVYDLGYTKKTTIRVGVKTGRNDPCHCGSSKKYKKCCGR